MTESIFIFAGELSGDAHGEKLVRALRKKYPSLRIFGVAGPKMRHAGMETLIPLEKFEVMGFIDVLFALPRLIRQFLLLRNTLLETQPKVALFIDYPGFSLALAKSVRKRGFKGKICQYICPSIWAWGKKRIPKMEKTLDHLFTIFPFETELFDPQKLKVHYVGNPTKHEMIYHKHPPLRIDPKYRIIGLFPGSRKKELMRNFPIHLQVVKELLNHHEDLFFVVSVAQAPFSLILDTLLKEHHIPKERFLFLDRSQNPSLMKQLTLAIAKSGTNNLELALHHVPTVVTYGIGPLDLFIAKTVLRIDLPFYCIANIIAGSQIFPELIGPHLTPRALFTHAHRFLSSEEAMKECREKCREMDKLLEAKTPESEILKILFDV